jgi:hypothetical protein
MYGSAPRALSVQFPPDPELETAAALQVPRADQDSEPIMGG